MKGGRAYLTFHITRNLSTKSGIDGRPLEYVDFPYPMMAKVPQTRTEIIGDGRAPSSSPDDQRHNRIDSIKSPYVYCVLLHVDKEQRHGLFHTPDADMLRDLERALGQQSAYLTRFYGLYYGEPTNAKQKSSALSVQHDALSAVYDMPLKGTLQQLLASDVEFDWEFRVALVRDYVDGLVALKALTSYPHARLSSRYTCLIDSRLNGQLGDWALHSVARKRIEEKDTYERMLWYSPERIKLTLSESAWHERAAASFEDDVYALGIVMCELANRAPPYQPLPADADLATAEAIVRRVADSSDLRPRLLIGESSEATPSEFATLVEACLREQYRERPRIDQLQRDLRELMRHRQWPVSDSDRVVQRMQQYTANLEALLRARDKELAEERNRAHHSFYQLLPTSIAKRLEAGEKLQPKWFDRCSLLQASCVNFAHLASQSRASEAVQMLHALQSLLDRTSERYDVFMADSLSDSCLMVSGAPIANGYEHLSNIASVSLALIEGVKHLVIGHLPKHKLMLRAGVHTGALATGIVGTRVPRYGLFGETLRRTQRIEAEGEAMAIHTSGTFHDLVEKHFAKRYRFTEQIGTSNISAASQKTYLLIGESASPIVQKKKQVAGESSPAKTSPHDSANAIADDKSAADAKSDLPPEAKSEHSKAGLMSRLIPRKLRSGDNATPPRNQSDYG